VISCLVPAAAVAATIGFTIILISKVVGGKGGNSSIGGLERDRKTIADEIYADLYESDNSMGGGRLPSFPFMSPKKKLPRNAGVPQKEYIKVEKLNERLNSYYYSVESALTSKAAASALVREQNFDSAFAKSVGIVTPGERSQLEEVEKIFLKKGGEILAMKEASQLNLIDRTCLKEMDRMGVEVGELDLDVETNSTDTNITVNKKESTTKMMPEFVSNMMDKEQRFFKEQLTQQKELVSSLTELELDFLADIMEILGPKRANAIRRLFLGSSVTPSIFYSLKDRPLSVLLSHGQKQNLFVVQFPGDAAASQLSNLREEVTSIIRSARKGDEALLVLQTGGGTVTGYGLAAAQLKRFKANDIKLTVCVEQVAASGGYMMCCVADRIVASPFAVLGSIGVISDIPNVYQRLKKEGIEFQTVTAGKYKRTLTPTKEPTKEDFAKTQADLVEVLVLFKNFVHKNRPSLDIDDVATGETWFGEDALAKKLCDEIATKDDILLEFVDKGYNVFDIKYEPPKTLDVPGGLGFANADGGLKNLVQRGFRWMAAEVVKEVTSSDFMSLQDQKSGVETRVMAKDEGNAKQRIRAEMMGNDDILNLF